MPPANACPRCGRPSPSNVTFCASCGANLSSSRSSKGWKLLLGAIAVFAGLAWAAALYAGSRPATQFAGGAQPQGPAGQGAAQAASQTAQPAPSASLSLTSAQHLYEAKRALADGYKRDEDVQKASWGEVAAAKWHLKAITTTAPEYREAQELLKEVARRERRIELARKKANKEGDEDSGLTAEADAADDDDSNNESAAAASSPTSSAYSSRSKPAPARAVPPAGTSGAGGSSSSDYYTNSRGVEVHRPVPSPSGPPAGATAQCADGTYSFSMSRRGTCSHHGGVSRWL